MLTDTPQRAPCGGGLARGAATLVGIAWASWTLAYLAVAGLWGNLTGTSLREVAADYVASFRYVWQPGLEVATMVQVVAVLVGVCLLTAWRGRRQARRARSSRHAA